MYMSHHRVCTHINPCEVLLVEDYDDQAQLAVANVVKYGDGGIRLIHVHTKAEAVQITKEKGAGLRLVLLDLLLPDSRGLQTFLDVKAVTDEAVPIVVLTNLVDSEVEDAVMRHGAQDYVLKSEIADGSRSLVRIIRHSVERNQWHVAGLKAAGMLAGIIKGRDADALETITEVKKNLLEMVVSPTG